MKHAAAILLISGLAPAALAQAPANQPADIKATYPLDPPKVETKAKYRVETIAEGLQVPWGFAFLPDGKRMLFTERPGRVRLIDAAAIVREPVPARDLLVEAGVLHPAPVFTVPDVQQQGEKGLMGICLHPEFEKNHWVYLAYGSTTGDIRIVRYVCSLVEGHQLTASPGTMEEATVILKGIPARVNHAGCRIRFGPDKKLYITTGETFKKELAPDLTSLGGKILRVNDDGGIPADNPFTSEEHKAKGVRGEIWSYGNRNPQGIDWDPKTGLLWETEHGPSGERIDPPSQGGDELNIIEKGHDYGWPTIHHDRRHEGMETPVIEWSPAIAPASGSFYNGPLFPEWKGNFFVGALGGLGGGKRPGIVRLVVDGRNVTGIEWIATEYNRIREVAQGPDGALWFSTSNKDGRAQPDAKDDRIMRIVPAKD